MITTVLVITLIVVVVALRKSGLWDKKVKDIEKVDAINLSENASNITISTVVGAIIYVTIIAIAPILGIAILMIFEILPWAFKSNGK